MKVEMMTIPVGIYYNINVVILGRRWERYT